MADAADQPSTSNEDDYGEATYAMSRHRKNKILVWKSREHEGRVYEFTLATRFKMDGVFSWRCLQCSLIKDKMKRNGESVKDKKVPLLLVDNDVLKENPDRPNNAAHFCEGRDLVESAVLRSKLLFYEAHEKSLIEPTDVVKEFVEEAANTAPFQLTPVQKRSIQEYVTENVAKIGMKKTLLRRRKTVGAKKSAKPHIVYEKFIQSSFSSPKPMKTRCDSDISFDETDELIDVEDVEGEIDILNNLGSRKYCNSFMKVELQQK
ncbi:unnamed protein product [Auanema sp. JU1783]|nr:unnamed protein product [Auanema sp. JU1783]